MKMNKVLILCLLMVLVAAPMVEAGLGDVIRDLGRSLGKFSLSEFYDDFPGLVDFIIFTVLFWIVLIPGLSKVGGKDSHWGMWAGFFLGLILAVAAVLTGLSLQQFKSFIPFLIILILALGLLLILKSMFKINLFWGLIISLVVVAGGLFVLDYTGLIDIFDFESNDIEDMTIPQIHNELGDLAAVYGVNFSEIDSNQRLSERERMTRKLDMLRAAMRGELSGDNAERASRDLDILDGLARRGGFLGRIAEDVQEGLTRFLGEANDAVDEYRRLRDAGELNISYAEQLQQQYNTAMQRIEDLIEQYGGRVGLGSGDEEFMLNESGTSEEPPNLEDEALVPPEPEIPEPDSEDVPPEGDVEE